MNEVPLKGSCRRRNCVSQLLDAAVSVTKTMKQCHHSAEMGHYRRKSLGVPGTYDGRVINLNMV